MESNQDYFQDFDVEAEFFNNDPQPEHIEILKSKFSHEQFRPKQWNIIRGIIKDTRDICAVMSTGYGKSLCFQYPAVFLNGIVLVISPLIALMQAQVLTLNNANISAQKDNDILSKIKNGRFNVIYSSPEYLQSARGNEMLYSLNGKLTLIAIDEAHCVSQWGHDFRPDFRKLNILRKILPNTPILAVTATATNIVRDDIINLLGLRNPEVVVTSFDRPNLEFSIFKKSTYSMDLPSRVRSVNGSVIVYVLRRTDSEKIAAFLSKCGIICEPYHAGLDIIKRTDVLEKFLKDELKVIVATIAFGMGIDKPDIRCIIHYGASKNLETYYQEVGRAGRDGKEAHVITFYNQEDFQLHDYFLNRDDRRGMVSSSVKAYLEGLALRMREFLYSKQCRRKIILEYFGEDTTKLVRRTNCCDNCSRFLRSGSSMDNNVIARRDNIERYNAGPNRYIHSNISFRYNYVVDLMFGDPSFYYYASDEREHDWYGEGDYSDCSYDDDDENSNDEEGPSSEEQSSEEEHSNDEQSLEEEDSNEDQSANDEPNSDDDESSDELLPIKRRKI